MNNGKRQICVVVTARPSYSRIRTALKAIDEHPDLELQLVVAASALLERYGNAIHAIERDGFGPPARVYMVLEGENLVTSAKSTGLGLVELATVFDNLKPDAVVTVADRYETLATAVAASYMNIPVVHVQGGEVTGSIDEKVRHAVTKLAEPPPRLDGDWPAERVIRLGEEPDTVVMTGCPSIDIAADVAARPALDFDPFEKYGGVGPREDLSKGYLVVMQHPVTTEYDEARAAGGRDALRREGRRPAGALVLAERGRRLRRHVEGHPGVPRARAARTTSISSATCFRRTSCGCSTASAAIVGNSSVADPGVLVSGRPGGQHRVAAAGPRARPERDRRGARPRRDRRGDPRAPAPRPAGAAIICMATASAGTRIADTLATARAAHREAALTVLPDRSGLQLSQSASV